MAEIIPMRQGDRFPSLAYALVDGNGDRVDLTTATAVRFHMGKEGRAAKVNAACTVDDAADGEVSYAWGSTDTDELGEFDADFEVTWPSGQPETFPSRRGDLQVHITSQIA